MLYFITEEELKRYSSVTENVDAKDLAPIVKTSADMWVRSILGTVFYNDLLVKYNANTLNSDEQALVDDYIKFCIIWATATDAVAELSYQLKNKGIQIQNGDYSSSPEYKAIMWNYHHKDDKAKFYNNRLAVYLSKPANAALFPVFESDDNDDSTVIINKCNGGGNNFDQSIIII